MPGPSPIERFEVIRRDKIAPAIYPFAHPLTVSVFQTRDPVPFKDAEQAEYRAVEPGFAWGPAWSTAWFRAEGAIPESLRDAEVVLRFDSGTEATLWLGSGSKAEPVGGYDVNRDAHVVIPKASVGDEFRAHIEAACNHPFGAQALQWDDDEVGRRWDSETPGRFHRCELAMIDRRAARLDTLFRFAIDLASDLDENSARRAQLLEALDRASTLVGTPGASDAADEAGSILEDVIRARASGSATICHAVGHAHIDTAWLWPIRETRRKTVRTFSNVLGLMERHPDFRFMCSQAQQYAWLEEDSPALFERIRSRVESGDWEPTGAMWIEPDCNAPSGESLIRQIIHGTRYWHDRFGTRAPQRLLYLPDTFGFPASLPQIMALAGLDTFITNKLSWNDTNPYPHTSFRWRGIDGTEVLAHFTPGHDYNATNTPKELRKGEHNHRDKDLGSTDGSARWLQPFGYGDGGGGPTDRQIEFSKLGADCDGLPRVRFGRADEFCAALHTDREHLRAQGRDFPDWEGELYLELHRGTFTTHAKLKRENRGLEHLLRTAELLASTGPDGADASSRDVLGRAWKLLLLNQFHDILPGSSISWVYEDAWRDYAEVRKIAQDVIDVFAPAWRDHVGGEAVLNPTSCVRPRVAEVGGEARWAGAPTAHGVSIIADQPDQPARVSGRSLSNGRIEAEIDDDGRVARLSTIDGTDVCADPLNRLVLYEDRPRMWDAWDIDAEYEHTGIELSAPDSVEVVEKTGLRAAIEVSRPIGENSRITQRYTLEAGSPRLDIRTRLEWREEHKLLRALFPTNVRTNEAVYDIQFGHYARANHRNTSFERARFEVPAHRWMLVAEPDRGLALLNDGRYGHSCLGGTMGISLARAPTYPDPEADRGVHEFTYSLMPFVGGWRNAGVIEEAEALNDPLIPLGTGTGDADSWAPFEIESPTPVEVAAVKPAEEGGRLIVRLVERTGVRARVGVRWNIPAKHVERVDLLERPIDGAIEHGGGSTSIEVRPFEIVTLAVG